MYNDFGIIFGMVYTLLPFMILPIYSAVSKVNNSVIEASTYENFELKNTSTQTKNIFMHYISIICFFLK